MLKKTFPQLQGMVESVLQVSSLYLVSYLHRYVIWSSTLLYRSFALPFSLSSLHLRPSSLKVVLKILTVVFTHSFFLNNKSIQGISSFFSIQPHIHISLSLFPLSPLSSLYTRCQVLLTFWLFLPSLVLSGAYSFQHQISLSSSLCSIIKPNTILAVFLTTTDCISITYWLLYLKYIVVVYRDKTTKTVPLGNKPWL